MVKASKNLEKSEAAKHLPVLSAIDSATACSITESKPSKQLPKLLSGLSPLNSQKITFPHSLYSSTLPNPFVFYLGL